MSTDRKNNEFSNVRVLVVDDEPLILELVEAVLRDIGIPAIYQARNGKEALDHFAGGLNEVDLVICDWMMPEMDGLELIRRLRAMRLEIPFLMLTRRRSARDLTAIKDVGVSGYLTKPFTPAQLREKVERLVTMLIKKRQSG